MKKLLVIWVLHVLCGAAFGQKVQSVLWKIEGNGLTKPSYLFGTVHVAPVALLDSFPEIMRIADGCDLAIFESGGSPIGDLKQVSDMQAPPLDSLFTPSEYALVDSFFIAHSFGSIRPHNEDADLISMIEVTMMLNNEATKERPDLFDDVFREILKDRKKPTFHLDIPTAADEIAKGISHRALAQFLVYLITNKPAFEAVVPKEAIDFHLYLKTLSNDMLLGQTADEQAQKNVIRRNYLWVPKIEAKLSEGSCFIAVGLLHLKYNEGLIKLLGNKGFTLTPVKL